MNNQKAIVVILLSIIILLIVGVSSEIKYSNRVQKKKQTSELKEIVIHKKEDKQEETNIKNDIDEELIDDSNNQEEKQNVIEKEEVINKVNTKVEEHHESPVQSSTSVYISQIDEIKNRQEKLGTAGRLYIPNININVGLNNAIIYNTAEYNAQEIVDKDDSAAYYTFLSKLTIADHDFQGFSRINYLNSGDKAFIKRSDGSVEEYQMIKKFYGKNIGTDLIDSNGNSVGTMTGNLIMYTCYENTSIDDNIVVTLWNKIS